LPTPERLTQRLTLRRWREADREPFAEMNADPVVMEHFPAPLDRERSDAFVERLEGQFEEHGFGPWAVEVTATGEFIGFVGLLLPSFHVDWMDQRQRPIVEVGWRLRRSAWGNGYASEGAREALRFGFAELGLREVYSFTVRSNAMSVAVMHRIGMSRLCDYDHPVPGGDPLPSVAYHVAQAGSS
jgi:RimJ/RimL family protein N-acetyltransferase